jgi:XTP/dITP diphosphohydrolase
MKKIVYFATSNKDKVRNAKVALRRFGIDVRQIVVELAESRAEDPAEIALEKARQAQKLLKKPVLVEDSGFFIRGLGGFPMTHIKFSLKTLGIKGILNALKGAKDRHAEWRMTLAYVWGPGKHKTFTFVEPGVIVQAPRPIKRPMMSDYWRIYAPTTMTKSNRKTLCEMSDADMRKWLDYFADHNQFMMFGRWYSAKR